MGAAALSFRIATTLRRAGGRRVALLILPIFIYGAFSVIYFAKTAALTKNYVGFGGDPIAFAWFLNWWPFAIRHGLDPLLSQYVWFPQGDNVTWDTSIPLAALLGLPATLLGGPVLAYNLLALTAPVLAGWTAFLLARELTADWAASLAGGYLFGFSSYQLGQMLGHLDLEMTFVVPLVALLCLRRGRGGIGRRNFIVGLVLLLLAQFGLAAEVLATMCALGAVSWTIFWLCTPSGGRAAIGRLAVDVLVAALIATILAAPFLLYMIKGVPDVSIPADAVRVYSADILNFVVPTSVTFFGRLAAAPLASRFAGNPAEQDAYLGLPLIGIMALYFGGGIGDRHARALLLTLIVFVVFSLGPVLHVAGRDTGLPLPWALVQDMPLLKSALPTRLAMYVDLCAAMAVALWLADRSARRPAARLVLAGLACLALLPNRPGLPWRPWPAPAFFTPRHVREVLGPEPNVLILPFSQAGPGLAWQLDAGMGFTQSGGYVGFTPRRETTWDSVGALTKGIVVPSFGIDLTAFCVMHRVDFILLGPGTPPALAAAIAALGWPRRTDRDVSVVRVPAASQLRYRYITGDYWPAALPLSWMGRRVRIVTKGVPTVLTITGQGRPLPVPVRITVSNAAMRATYTLLPSSTLNLPLPINGTTTVTAGATFEPDLFLPDDPDRRQLSALIALGP